MRDTLGVFAAPRAPALCCWMIVPFLSFLSLQLLRLARGNVETARGAKAVVWDARRRVETHFLSVRVDGKRRDTRLGGLLVSYRPLAHVS